MSIEGNGFYTNGILTDYSYDTTNYLFSNGKCVYDSSYGLNSLNQQFYSVNQYQYLPAGKLIIYFTGHSPSYTNTSTANLYQTSDGIDITQQLDTTKNTSPINNQFYEVINTATYISNPNPMSKFSNPVRRPRLWDDIGIGSQRAAPRKLFSQHHCTYDFINGSTVISHNDWRSTYSYSFRPDGYPSEAREIFSDNGTLTYLKTIFIYQ